MNYRIGMASALTALLLCLQIVLSRSANACCPTGPEGVPVVNADQSVIILWDAAAKTQHFIRRATFASQADDFGFLVPSPNRPELAESGNDAFPYLQKLTEPEIKLVPVPRSRGDEKKSEEKKAEEKFVKVLEQKLVAGFQASVLETNSAEALVDWLKGNGYAFSAEVEAWAKPYIKMRWIITALKVAKEKGAPASQHVSASALRMSFKTERPLFPYREPDSRSAAELLGAKRRLLRIYFIGDGRYQGELTKEQSWTGQVVWSGQLQLSERERVLELLKLPSETGPAEWWLTEFEDDWPYRVAEGDVYFSKDKDQSIVRRPPIINYYYDSSAPSPIAAKEKSGQTVETGSGFDAATALLIGGIAGGLLIVVGVIVFFRWRRRTS